MSFFSDLSAEITKAVKAAETAVVAAAKFFAPVVEATAAELGQAALTAVLQQAPLVISGSEKLSGAITTVAAQLSAQGKAAGLALIQTAVQDTFNQVSQLANSQFRAGQ